MPLIRQQLVIVLLLCLLAFAWWGLILTVNMPRQALVYVTPRKDSLVKQYAKAGHLLFDKNCKPCHNLNATDNMLTNAAVTNNEPYQDYLVDFLLYPDSMARANSYAKAMYNSF